MSSLKTIPIITMSVPADQKRITQAIEARRSGNPAVVKSVETICSNIKRNGDKALFSYAKKFDGVSINAKTIRLDPKTFKKIGSTLAPGLKRAIIEAAKRIRAYHIRQTLPSFSLKTAEGTLSQIIRPIGRVGLYVPGGYTVYPSTVLMDVIPAQLAGVKEIAVATPCRGGLDARLAFVFDLLGITEVYQVGGAHAVAALAYGTKSVPAVDKIVGPGNSYVSIAKRLVYGTVDIDMVAGPSEVVIMADRSANPEWVALDLLSQAEHGTGDEMAICVVESRDLAGKISRAVSAAIEASPVKAVFKKLSAMALCVCVTRSRAESIALINEIAPEHLQIMTKTCKKDLEQISNAAAVFLGPYSPVPLGDYYVGTNHVLPTGRAARYASPLGVPSFLKRISVAEISAKGIKKCAKNAAMLARAEKFEHHALCIEARV